MDLTSTRAKFLAAVVETEVSPAIAALHDFDMDDDREWRFTEALRDTAKEANPDASGDALMSVFDEWLRTRRTIAVIPFGTDGLAVEMLQYGTEGAGDLSPVLLHWSDGVINSWVEAHPSLPVALARVAVLTFADQTGTYFAVSSYNTTGLAETFTPAAVTFLAAHVDEPHVGYPTTCRNCGETFVPNGKTDTFHAAREDGTECGGPGQITY